MIRARPQYSTDNIVRVSIWSSHQHPPGRFKAKVALPMALLAFSAIFLLGILFSARISSNRSMLEAQRMPFTSSLRPYKATHDSSQVTNDASMKEYMQARERMADMRRDLGKLDSSSAGDESTDPTRQTLTSEATNIRTVVQAPNKAQNGQAEDNAPARLAANPARATEKHHQKAEGLQQQLITPSQPIYGSGAAADSDWLHNLRDTVLLVIAHNRESYLQRCLRAVTEYHPRHNLLPIVISEDGRHPVVAQVVEQQQQEAREIKLLHIHHSPDLTAINGYVRLSAHYRWALTQTFSVLSPQLLGLQSQSVGKVIILEEDLEVAPDVFCYFGSLAPFLEADPSLWAISAWNDNGQTDRVRDPQAVYRSDFFPGLGWMLKRELWDELEPRWPKGYWDDFLREPAQRKGRQVLRPEICRVYHFGHIGTSEGQYSSFLQSIKLSSVRVPFHELDLSYLWPDAYARHMAEEVDRATAVSVATACGLVARQGVGDMESVKVFYAEDAPDEHSGSFADVARKLGIMDNIKARVPRTAYKGIVSFWIGNAKVHLIPRAMQ